MKLILFAVLLLLLVIPVAIWLDIRHEVEEFNNGKCLECGGKLRFQYDDDERGSVYECGDCGRIVDVTYAQVDKNYLEE